MTRPKKDVRFQHRGSIPNGNSKARARSAGSDNSAEGSDENVVWEKEDDTAEQVVVVQTDYEKKKASFITRTIWTLVMIAIFFIAMFAGHIYMIMIVTAIQIISFKEVIAISNVPSRARSLRFTKTLNWYFLGVSLYFLYGKHC